LGLRIGVVFNLKRNAVADPPDAEAEFDDIETISAIKNALELSGYDVALYEADAALPLKLANEKPDAVFNIAEGSSGRGREAQVPAILNFLNIPFTGSDETTMCVAMDKALTKQLLSLYDIVTPKFKLISPAEQQAAGLSGAFPDAEGLCYPLIVKPNAEGSGKGISDISIADDHDALRRAVMQAGAYNQPVLVEEYISGREFTVGILGDGDRERVFEPMEIIFRDPRDGIYSYDVKRRFKDYVDYRCPPDISADARDAMISTASKIYGILSCRDMGRIDFRMSDDGRLYFIEINPLPGLAPGYSDYPMLAEFCGVGYDSLIQGVMESALTRRRG